VEVKRGLSRFRKIPSRRRVSIMDPYEWVTDDFRLKHRRSIEELQSDLNEATSAAAYSWIRKANITKALSGEPKRALDVGCGWGREIARFPQGVGIDICLSFLKTARNYMKNDFILADAHFLPFRDKTFDFVYMSEVLEHLTEPTKAIDEIARVIESRGRFVVQTPNKRLTRHIAVDPKYRHLCEYNTSELVELLASRGFHVLKRNGSTIPYIPTSNRFYRLNFNRYFLRMWKLADSVFPFKWDIILCCEPASDASREVKEGMH